MAYNAYNYMTLDEMLAGGTPLFDGARSPVPGTILACVQAHGLGIEQADDQTQLVLRYNGPSSPMRNDIA